MVNEDYRPDATEDAVMTVLRREQRATPYLIREESPEDLSKQDVNRALSGLSAAGWVSKRTRGLYDYVEDPRVGHGAERAEAASTRPESSTVSNAREALAEWDPQDVDSLKARRATAATYNWLSEQEGPMQKSEIVDFLKTSDAVAEYATSTAWQKVVRPGLRELGGAGLVEYRTNVGYEIAD